MDGHRFDEFTRLLAARTPRRTLLRALAGGAAGLAVGLGRSEPGMAKSCATNADCDFCESCVIDSKNGKGKCVAANDGLQCGACGTCMSGKCRANNALCGDCYSCDRQTLQCESDPKRVLEPCGSTGCSVCSADGSGGCVALADGSNCNGRVGVCCNGACQSGGSCCSEACGECEYCAQGGQCAGDSNKVMEPCGSTGCGVCAADGSGRCDALASGSTCNGRDGVCCGDGSCIGRGECCPSERRCPDGQCVTTGICCAGERRCADNSCVAPGTCCGGAEPEVPCSSVATGCCSAGQICTAGGCCSPQLGEEVCGQGGGSPLAICCRGGMKCCDGECRSTCCGGQTLECPVDQYPDPFTCECKCYPDMTECFGICTYTQSDSTNCGDCGIVCDTQEECLNGVCRCPNTCESPLVQDPGTCRCACPAGQVLCGGACVSNDCLDTLTFNFSTCQCECRATECLELDQFLNPAICQCSSSAHCEELLYSVHCSPRGNDCPTDYPLECGTCLSPNACCPEGTTCCKYNPCGMVEPKYDRPHCCQPGFVCNPFPGIADNGYYVDACVCPSGVVCGGVCCPAGQTCDSGACV